MNQPSPLNEIDRLRGWSLAALYGAFSLLSLLLVFAAFRIWPATVGAEMEVFAVAVTGSATVVAGLRACVRFVRALRTRGPVPAMALTPFVFITLTLFASSLLFRAL